MKRNEVKKGMENSNDGYGDGFILGVVLCVFWVLGMIIYVDFVK